MAILDFLAQYEGYLLTGHVEPDADCVGSILALASFLHRRGKSTWLINAGPFQRIEVKTLTDRFLPTPPEPSEIRAVIGDGNLGLVMVDCCSRARVGTALATLPDMPTAIIDHHLCREPIDAICYLEPAAPAAGLLVLSIIEAIEGRPTLEEAEWLMFAIMSDTEFLRHVDPQDTTTIRAVVRLIDVGATVASAYRRIDAGYNLATYKLFSRYLQRVESHFDGALLLTWESHADQLTQPIEFRNTSMLYRSLLSVQGCCVAVFIHERSDAFCHISLRSREGCDVESVAHSFGGGGHRKAAGFDAPYSIEKTRSLLLERFRGQFER